MSAACVANRSVSPPDGGCRSVVLLAQINPPSAGVGEWLLGTNETFIQELNARFSEARDIR